MYGGSDAPVVFHLGSMNKILSLPVPDGVVSQGAIFAKDNVRKSCEEGRSGEEKYSYVRLYHSINEIILRNVTFSFII